jgi:hypothetical protein
MSKCVNQSHRRKFNGGVVYIYVVALALLGVSKGPFKKNTTDLDAVGWFLGGHKSTSAGQIVFRDLFIVFLTSHHRETPINVINKNKKNAVLFFLVDFFVKTFRHNLFVTRFFFVFFNSHRRKTPENAIKRKKVEQKLIPKFLSIFSENVFDMDFLQKYFNGVFELPLPRNAQKRTKTMSRKKIFGVG